MTKQILHVMAVATALCITFMAVMAQEPTPIIVQLATSTPLPILGAPTLMPTPIPTETPIGGAQLEAKDSVNVRSEASTEAGRLGLIAPGERYVIVGRYYRWLQFRYPNSPSGTGWVYDELVDIHGDLSLIPDLSEAALPTSDPIIDSATMTALAIVSVPGGEMTATAGARILAVPTNSGGADPFMESNLNPDGGERLPTFTPAPNVNELVAQLDVMPTNTPERAVINITTEQGALPPILPIFGLVGLGLFGLAVSFIRR